MKKQEGITLIALVITIIVLLILAGVSIAMISGSDGILTKASKAGAQTKVEEEKESVNLKASEALSTFYDEKYVNNTQNLGTVQAYVEQKLSDAGYTVTEHKVKTTNTDENGKAAVGTISNKGTISWATETGT